MTMNLISKLPTLICRKVSRPSIAAHADVPPQCKRRNGSVLPPSRLVFDFCAVVRYRRRE